MKRHLLVWNLVAVGIMGCSTPQVRIPPQVTYQVPPIYPADLIGRGIAGEVLVGFVVDTRGVPLDPFIFRSTRREFEAPAIAAVQEWRFKPGTLDGKPVNTKMTVPIVFSFEDEKPNKASLGGTVSKEERTRKFRQACLDGSLIVVARIHEKDGHLYAECTETLKSPIDSPKIGEWIPLPMFGGSEMVGRTALIVISRYPPIDDYSGATAYNIIDDKIGFADLSIRDVKKEIQKQRSANKAAEPSRTTDTAPAGAGDRASGTPGSP
jgi:TonB family protein